mmetsp:Transcript_7061/g.10307  ORF Transcript_7061/g.10307 Transcript_7061/m.10307 type:complete len:538 (+) Transcript_7061:67-1680(+)
MIYNGFNFWKINTVLCCVLLFASCEAFGAPVFRTAHKKPGATVRHVLKDVSNNDVETIDDDNPLEPRRRNGQIKGEFNHLSEDNRLVNSKYIAESNLPTDLGMFRMRAYRNDESDHDTNPFTGNEPVVIYAPEHPLGTTSMENVPIRVHDQCLTSEVFGSYRCDCWDQFRMALKYIKKNGGALIYLQQEGRGIGLANKIHAYSLQDGGMDTVEANLHLGFPEDMRQYGAIPSILKDLKVKSIKLMTNNPRKVHRLSTLGVTIEDIVPMVIDEANPHNKEYIETKVKRMNHQHFGNTLAKNDAFNNGIMAPKRKSTEGVLAREDGYCFGRKSVEDAIAAVARGEMVVVVDDMNRENEGDLIMASDACTPEAMAKIIRYSSGVICVAMEGDRMDELDLPAMVTNNEDPKETAFAVTVDGTKEHGITTGISATDRSRTVQLLARPSTVAKDLSRPGHIFPLRAKAGGVLERDGHTEATVDLSRLARRGPCGVLCEIVSEENPTEMARLPELIKFSHKQKLVLTSIVDLQQYRRDTEQNEK